MMEMTAQHARALIFILWCFCMASSAAYAGEPGNVRGRSAGCGIVQTGNGEFVRMEIHVLGRNRTYHLRVPGNYDGNRAYPLIFRWHGSGGNGLSGGLGIEFISRNDAIVVGADGLDKNWDSKTDSDELLLNDEYDYLKFNTDPVDLLFFDRMLATISKQYCIDRDRIFSYGFSVGGYFTNLLACERGDVLRASAAVSGGIRGGNCKGKVAAWFLHDSDDHVVPIAEGRAARDRAIATNGCSTNTVDEGDGCVRYQGCETNPVVWCESKGIGHNIRGDFAPARVWRFFQELR
jgi:polyhydroxybutyrate depolymerase